MIRYVAYLIIYLAALVVALVVTPLLPLFKVQRIGGINNDERKGMGWKLPVWLSWFDTPDNSLLGDDAHKLRYSNPEGWLAMTCWLYRNPLYGFKWGPLGYRIEQAELVTNPAPGEWRYFDAFQWRKPWLGHDRTFGWILDAYYRRDNKEPKAIFVFWN